MKTKKYWDGDPGTCDLCGVRFESRFFDGKMAGQTCWAKMCQYCHGMKGDGTGLGIGQEYRKTPAGWLKVRG